MKKGKIGRKGKKEVAKSSQKQAGENETEKLNKTEQKVFERPLRDQFHQRKTNFSRETGEKWEEMEKEQNKQNKKFPDSQILGFSASKILSF